MTDLSSPAGPVTAGHSSSALLSVHDLTTVFETREGVVRAVDGVSFDLPEGRTLGIVGESGSGKSVTARSIMRLVQPPGRITGGEVLLDGTDLLRLTERRMRDLRGRKVSMVFQDPLAALNPVMMVGAQLVEALRLHGTARAAARTRATELLDLVGIADARNRQRDYPHQFSGGMRQRLVIAMALAHDPAVLIADEPTTALDVTIQAQILDLLARLRRELSVSVILITHDLGVVAEFCHEVVVMYAGRVVEQGDVTTIFTAPRHPYTLDLLRSVPRVSEGGGEPLPSIPGQPPDLLNPPPACRFHPRCHLAEDVCRTAEPQLLDVGAPGHKTACWVAQRGTKMVARSREDVPSAAPSERRTSDALLAVEDLVTDVSGDRGILRRPDPVLAVAGVSLAVGTHETVGLVGESGSGKSTLARTILGISPRVSGRIMLEGNEIGPDAEGIRRLRRTVQYVFQDPYSSLNPRMTIRQVLDEALAVQGLPPNRRAARSRELLAMVGLGDRHLDSYPHAFSGGQRQRIGIARALAVEPRMVICDEPVSALDVSIQAQIINLLQELEENLGLSYLFIAHDLAVVQQISARVAVMYLGRIVETGPVDEVFTRPQHPYTAALLSSVPVPDPGRRERTRITLAGDVPSPKHPPRGCRFHTRCPIGPMARPERTICVEQEPQLAGSGDQQAACHFPDEWKATGAADLGAVR